LQCDSLPPLLAGLQCVPGNSHQIYRFPSFDPSHFTRRELRIMASLAEEFSDPQADEIIETTHLENQPWHQIYVEQRRRQGRIPYELAFTSVGTRSHAKRDR
jgi:hypothetical protein